MDEIVKLGSERWSKQHGDDNAYGRGASNVSLRVNGYGRPTTCHCEWRGRSNLPCQRQRIGRNDSASSQTRTGHQRKHVLGAWQIKETNKMPSYGRGWSHGARGPFEVSVLRVLSPRNLRKHTKIKQTKTKIRTLPQGPAWENTNKNKKYTGHERVTKKCKKNAKIKRNKKNKNSTPSDCPV